MTPLNGGGGPQGRHSSRGLEDLGEILYSPGGVTASCGWQALWDEVGLKKRTPHGLKDLQREVLCTGGFRPCMGAPKGMVLNV